MKKTKSDLYKIYISAKFPACPDRPETGECRSDKHGATQVSRMEWWDFAVVSSNDEEQRH